MKPFHKIQILIAGLGIPLFSVAQNQVIPANQIKEVTVYMQGAQVTRETSVSTKPGKNEIVLEGLEEGIYANTIQVSAPQDILIAQVKHEVNYLKKNQILPRVQVLADSLELLQKKLDQLKVEQSIILQEKAIVLANQNMKGTDNGVPVDELIKAADFFRARLTELSNMELKNARAQKEVVEKKQFVNAQLNELNYRKNQPSNDIVISIDAKTTGTVKMYVRYVIQNAGWTPGYDLRAKDTKSPLQLDYRADVMQQSGHDWKDVLLTLSTGNPMQAGTRPDLQPWNLYVQAPVLTAGYITGGKAGNKLEESRDEYEAEEQEKLMVTDSMSYTWGFGDGSGTTLSSFTEVSNGATVVEFRIQVKQDIPSDGQNHQVNIQSNEIKGSYRHYAVPKLDPDAFLVAEATGWESLNLLPGWANIFFEGTYVTQSWLDPSVTEDTLKFSLGRDKKVVVTRETLKEFSKRQAIGTSRQRTFAYEISVRNTKSEPVNITIEDQVPVSQDKTITVDVQELSGAKKDEFTGLLHWDMTIAPNETKKVKLIYTVKYPKNKIVPGI